MSRSVTEDDLNALAVGESFDFMGTEWKRTSEDEWTATDGDTGAERWYTMEEFMEEYRR